MNIVLSAFAGMIIGAAGNYLGGKYYEKRFNKKWENFKSYIVAVLICGCGGVLFSLYGYSYITIFCYIVLNSALLVIGSIDRKEMIIPNAILLTLFCIRTFALVTEMLIYKEAAIFIFLSSIMGIFYGAVIFLIARVFGKDGIGMGDVKLFAVIGYFVGNKVILWLMLASLLIAMFSGLVRIACRKLSFKDSVSFGPYITAGSILVMFLGV